MTFRKYIIIRLLTLFPSGKCHFGTPSKPMRLETGRFFAFSFKLTIFAFLHKYSWNKINITRDFTKNIQKILEKFTKTLLKPLPYKLAICRISPTLVKDLCKVEITDWDFQLHFSFSLSVIPYKIFFFCFLLFGFIDFVMPFTVSENEKWSLKY